MPVSVLGERVPVYGRQWVYSLISVRVVLLWLIILILYVLCWCTFSRFSVFRTTGIYDLISSIIIYLLLHTLMTLRLLPSTYEALNAHAIRREVRRGIAGGKILQLGNRVFVGYRLGNDWVLVLPT